VNDGKWHVALDQEIDVDTVMRNRLEFDFEQVVLEGALLYQIRRKHTKFAKSAHNESKSTQLLVVWHAENTKGLDMRSLLIEHDKEFNWDEDKLRRLYQKYWHSLSAWINLDKSNWLLNSTTALETTIKVMNGDYRWDIFISKGTKYHVKKPLWIDAER
jgi:hypothetical protein